MFFSLKRIAYFEPYTIIFYREFNEKSFQNTRSFFWCKENENLIKMLTVYIYFYK